jgi:hypothetical protein
VDVLHHTFAFLSVRRWCFFLFFFSGCIPLASFLTFPFFGIAGFGESEDPANVAEVGDIVTFLATMKVIVDTSESVAPKWASDRFPTQQLMAGEGLPRSVASAFWLEDNAGSSRTLVRAVAGSSVLEEAYDVHSKILKPYTPGLGNLVVGQRSSVNDLTPPVVRHLRWCNVSR